MNRGDILKDISILMPYRSDNGHRENVFRWLLTFYEFFLPETEICIGESDSKLFSRAQSLNNAASKATRDIFVIADADLFYDPTILITSTELLKDYGWVVPYYSINYVSQESTDQLLTTSPKWPLEFQLDAQQIKLDGDGITGGICIVPRKHFEYVGGYDTRFEGWGGEDDAFGFAMNTLCGSYARLDFKVFHLWHPNKWGKGNPKYKENFKLFKKYKACNENKACMKKLIAGRKS